MERSIYRADDRIKRALDYNGSILGAPSTPCSAFGCSQSKKRARVIKPAKDAIRLRVCGLLMGRFLAVCSLMPGAAFIGRWHRASISMLLLELNQRLKLAVALSMASPRPSVEDSRG